MSDSEMIFELAYQLPGGRNLPSLADLRRFFKELPDLQANGSSGWRYFNPDTQVSCDFLAYQPRDREAGLSFELALPRARFFALECLPMAVALAREFELEAHLLPLDQRFSLPELTFEVLLESWEKANLEEATLLEEDGVALVGLEQRSLEALWEFQLLRTEMARRYHRDGIQVPPLMLWEERKTGRLVRVAEWKGLTSAGLGDCDYYLLTQPPEPLPSGVLVAAKEFPEVARFAYRDLAQPVYHRLFDKARTRSELIEAVAKMDRLDPKAFQEIPWSEIVDLEVSSKR
jgi:hypothetical protein